MSNLTVQDEEIKSSLPAARDPHASIAVSLARVEIDQQIATARAFPRSIQRAISQITTLATLDEETAAECIYALPRGGKTVRGPSIRFAEIMVSQWCNCRIGARVVHVDKVDGFVEAEAVFHDLETNVAQTARIIRIIQAKRGKGIDNDAIQTTGAAASSIARRNAILAGIPRGIGRRALLAVEDVIRGDIKTLEERRDIALAAFNKLGVTSDRVFTALGIGGAADITLDHLVTLTGARSALKNGESTIEEMFPKPETKGTPAKSLGEKLDALGKKLEEREAATHDAETGEITQQQETDAGAGDPSSQAAGTDAGARDSAGAAPAADQDGEPDTRTEEERLLDEARQHAMEGRRVFDRFYNSLSADNLDRINPHMSALMKVAKQADEAAKKTGA